MASTAAEAQVALQSDAPTPTPLLSPGQPATSPGSREGRLRAGLEPPVGSGHSAITKRAAAEAAALSSPLMGFIRRRQCWRTAEDGIFRNAVDGEDRAESLPDERRSP